VCERERKREREREKERDMKTKRERERECHRLTVISTHCRFEYMQKLLSFLAFL
jgi:hypothetical protein